MLVQNSSMKYLQDLGTASVPYLFRGLIYVGIQYDHKRDDCGGKVDLAAWRARRIEAGEIIAKFDIPGRDANIFGYSVGPKYEFVREYHNPGHNDHLKDKVRRSKSFL